jgi:hypothetical protein
VSLTAGLPTSRRELFGAIRRIPVGFGYAVALLLSNLVMGFLSDPTQTAVASATSTNIAHLATDPVFVLPASAFFDTSNSWLWVPLSLVLIGGLERRFGSRRALLVVFGAHVMATLISEGVLLAQIAAHSAAKSDIDVLDVGPSYVILAAMAACLAVGSRSLRIFALVSGVLIVPGLLVELPQLDMASVGHFCALLFGAGFALTGARVAGWARITRREAFKVATNAGSRAADVAAPVISAVTPKARVSP